MKTIRAALSQLPNVLTLTNLICGILAIILAFDIDLIQYSIYLVLAAMIFDFLDGFAARSLGAYSEFGKQLDSLADMVSFGVAPGIMAVQLMKISIGQNDWLFALKPFTSVDFVMMYMPLLIPLFSAIRLAKFNLDERQKSEFYGLPTPASAFLIASILFVVLHPSATNNQLINFLLNKITLISVIIIDSILMVSNIKMFSLKFKNLSWRDNSWKYIFLILALLVIITLKIYGFPLIIVIFILISLIRHFKEKILASK